jgi:hypothetical protein
MPLPELEAGPLLVAWLLPVAGVLHEVNAISNAANAADAADAAVEPGARLTCTMQRSCRVP